MHGNVFAESDIWVIVETMSNPEGMPGNKPKSLEVKRDTYDDLINDFGTFISLNAIKLDQQILPGKESELVELRKALQVPVINGLSYIDFISQHWQKLREPQVSQALVAQIYSFLTYLEPRLSIFKENSDWVKRFEILKAKYTSVALGQ